MNKILWTKSNIEKDVRKQLDCPALQHYFLDVISITHKTLPPFELNDYTLIFTSVNGVKAFFENNFIPQNNTIYAVGTKTQKALEEYNLKTSFVEKNAEDLTSLILAQNHRKEKFLHFCGNLALDTLEKALLTQGFHYEKKIVYETKLLYPKAHIDYDTICFFSPSGVRSFAQYNSLEEKTIFCIGSTTEKEVRKYTSTPVISSNENTIENLFEQIKKHY